MNALLLNETHFRALMELIPVGIFLADDQGRCQYANTRWLNMIGMTLSEASGDGWMNGLHPEDRERVADAWGEIVEPEGEWEMEYRFQTPDGKVTWVLGLAAVVRDENGQITGYLGTTIDLTYLKYAEDQLKAYSVSLEEQVQAHTRELEAAQDQLIRREKLAALGQLAGSVSHELRNPLSLIYNAAAYLQMTLEGTSDTVKEHLKLISTTAREAEAIISDLLDFSRTRTIERSPVAVESLIDGTLVRHPVPSNVELALDIAADLPLLWVDARQMGQVLNNLITNAYQAMDEGGRLTLSAQAEQDRVILAVTDTGCGIPPEDQGHIFEPLFTTKARGIGLGLALSKNYVEMNEGAIDFKSAPGEGCTFTVWLPVHNTLHQGHDVC